MANTPHTKQYDEELSEAFKQLNRAGQTNEPSPIKNFVKQEKFDKKTNTTKETCRHFKRLARCCSSAIKPILQQRNAINKKAQTMSFCVAGHGDGHNTKCCCCFPALNSITTVSTLATSFTFTSSILNAMSEVNRTKNKKTNKKVIFRMIIDGKTIWQTYLYQTSSQVFLNLCRPTGYKKPSVNTDRCSIAENFMAFGDEEHRYPALYLIPDSAIKALDLIPDPAVSNINSERKVGESKVVSAFGWWNLQRKRDAHNIENILYLHKEHLESYRFGLFMDIDRFNQFTFRNIELQLQITCNGVLQSIPTTLVRFSRDHFGGATTSSSAHVLHSQNNVKSQIMNVTGDDQLPSDSPNSISTSDDTTVTESYAFPIHNDYKQNCNININNNNTNNGIMHMPPVPSLNFSRASEYVPSTMQPTLPTCSVAHSQHNGYLNQIMAPPNLQYVDNMTAVGHSEPYVDSSPTEHSNYNDYNINNHSFSNDISDIAPCVPDLPDLCLQTLPPLSVAPSVYNNHLDQFKAPPFIQYSDNITQYEIPQFESASSILQTQNIGGYGATRTTSFQSSDSRHNPISNNQSTQEVIENQRNNPYFDESLMMFDLSGNLINYDH